MPHQRIPTHTSGQNALVSNTSSCKAVRVRVPPPAPLKISDLNALLELSGRAFTFVGTTRLQQRLGFCRKNGMITQIHIPELAAPALLLAASWSLGIAVIVRLAKNETRNRVKQPTRNMKQSCALIATLLFLASCKTVTGVVVDQSGTPVKQAMVSIDCARKAVRTSDSGHFYFKTRAGGKKCVIRAWNPADHTGRAVVREYTYKNGGVEIVLNQE